MSSASAPLVHRHTSRDADMWYTELSPAERGVEYRYLIVQYLRTGEDVGLRVTRRETFIQPRRLSISRCSSPTDGELPLVAHRHPYYHANLDTDISVGSAVLRKDDGVFGYSDGEWPL